MNNIYMVNKDNIKLKKALERYLQILKDAKVSKIDKVKERNSI